MEWIDCRRVIELVVCHSVVVIREQCAFVLIDIVKIM